MTAPLLDTGGCPKHRSMLTTIAISTAETSKVYLGKSQIKSQGPAQKQNSNYGGIQFGENWAG